MPAFHLGMQAFFCRPGYLRFFLHIASRVHIIHVLLIELFTKLLDGFSKSLEMDDLPFPQEPDDVIDVGIVTDAQDVVIGDARLLFCQGVP